MTEAAAQQLMALGAANRSNSSRSMTWSRRLPAASAQMRIPRPLVGDRRTPNPHSQYELFFRNISI